MKGRKDVLNSTTYARGLIDELIIFDQRGVSFIISLNGVFNIKRPRHRRCANEHYLYD